MRMQQSDQMNEAKPDRTGRIGKSRIIAADFNTLFSEQLMEQTRHEIIKDAEERRNTITQQKPIDIYRLIHPIIAEHMHRAYTQRDHILSCKTYLDKCKRIEIHSVFLNHMQSN